MKCKSCNETISQKFAHALASNVCPMCGNEIMPLELQVALSELREVFKGAPSYHTELLDWLSTNHNLISRDSAEYKGLQEKAELAAKMPTKAVIKASDPNKVELDTNGNQIAGEVLQDQSTTNVFLQRAQVKTLNQQDKYRQIVNQIKKGGSSAAESNMMTMVAQADAEEVAAMEAELTGGEPAIQSGLRSTDFDGDDEDIPAVVQAMANQASLGAKSAEYNARDVAKLQQLQGKSQRAKNAMSRGGSVGFIKRSE